MIICKGVFKCRRYVTAGVVLVMLLVVSALGSKNAKFTDPQSYRLPASATQKVTDQDLVEIAKRWKAANGISKQQASPRPRDDRMRRVVARLQQQPLDLAVLTAKTSLAGTVREFAANGTPVFMVGAGLAKSASQVAAAGSQAEMLLDLIAAHRELFQLADPSAELQLVETIYDRRGCTHVVFDQHYQGVPFWGQRLIGHFDERSEFYLLTARYSPTPTELPSVLPMLDRQQAIRLATAALGATGMIRQTSPLLQRTLDYDGPEARLYVWSAHGAGEAHLVWQVEIRPNLRDRWYYFVDAHNGEILQAYNNTQTTGPATASAIDLNGVSQTVHSYESSGTYRLIDASRQIWPTGQSDPFNDPEGAIVTYDLMGQNPQWGQFDWISSTDNTWSDAISVSAHYHAGEVFQYFYDTHGRESVDGSGGNMISVIHVTGDNGLPMDNAYWNGRYVSWGDGNIYFTPLAGALDVCAHEFTHGIIDYTVQLEYQFQSGALNESFADVGGVLVDDEDWLLGEDIVVAQYFPSGALRDMADPHNGAQAGDPDWQPAHMDEYVVLSLSEDNGGVHINCGIPNKAAYLIGTAIGREKMGAIYYRILEARYLGRYAQFIDMRLAAIQAAEELYGGESVEVQAVKDAFTAVGLGEGGGSDPPPDNPVPEGDEWIAFVNDEFSDNSLYLGSPDNPPTLQQLSPTQVYTNTGKPIDVSGDGSLLVFVDANNDIRSINIDTAGSESILSNSGDWAAVALSPDGSKLAANTIFADSAIHIIYLDYPDSSRTIQLYSPTTQDSVRDYITEYADVMDWDANGEFLVFDAFNRVEQVGGDDLEFWEVNLLDVEQELIIRMFPPQSEGVSMGNPTFAETNDLFLAFDKNNVDECGNEIIAVNLFTAQEGQIINNGCLLGGEPNLGFPKFAPNDGMLVYQTEFLRSIDLRRIGLSEDRLNSQGRSEPWVNNALLPHWFVKGTAVAVEDEQQGTLPEAFTLRQNFPNPFNPTTVIEFAMQRPGRVSLEVYNIAGQRVATLIDGFLPAGQHRVSFNSDDYWGGQLASGVYLYRLRAGESAITRKMVLLK